MNLLGEAQAVARAGTPEDGVAFIERKAADGDPEGNFILAHWHLYGSDRPRDVQAARRCLETAAASGSGEALRLLAHLTLSGIGTAPDRVAAMQLLKDSAQSDPIAERELATLPKVMGDEQARAAPKRVYSAEPYVAVVEDLLNQSECAYLIERAEPSLRPSLVDDPIRGRGVPDLIRTSHGAAFLPHDEDFVIHAINRRLAAASGTAPGNGEALYVMRYVHGQEYRPHHDALPGLTNQRVWTLIAYLNSEYEGGATAFPDIGLELRLDAGDVLVFCNVDSEGRPHPKMLHAGLPVTQGAKWIATRWVRAGPHDPYDRT